MLNIVKSEWIKLKNRKSFLICLILFLILQMVVLINNINKNHIENNKYYNDILENLTQDYDLEYQKYSNIKKEIDLLLEYTTQKDLPEELKHINPLSIDVYEKYKTKIEKEPNFATEYDLALGESILKLDYANNFEKRVATGVEELKTRKNNPMIANDYMIKSIDRQIEKYTEFEQKDKVIKIDKEKGIDIFSNNFFVDIILFIFLFIMAILIFLQEYEIGMNNLIETISYGNKKNFIAKSILLILFSIFLTFFTYLAITTFIYFVFGFGDLNRNIQSIMRFGSLEINISVLNFIILTILQKILVFIYYGSILILISYFTKSTLTSVLITTVFLILNYALYLYISDYSYITIIKRSTLFSLINTNFLFGTYSDLNLIFTVISNRIYSLIYMILATIFNFYFAYRFSLIRKVVKLNIPNKFIKNISFKNLYSYELYNILVLSKGIFIIILSIFAIYNVAKLDIDVKVQYDRISYVKMLKEFKGKVDSKTLEKIKDIKKQNIEIEEKRILLEEKYKNKEISRREYLDKIYQLKEKEDLIPIFEKISSNILNAYEITNKSKDLHVIDEIQEKFKFEDNKNKILISSIMYIFLIIVVSSQFILDKKYNLYRLIKNTSRGYKKAIKNKILIYTFIALILFFVANYFVHYNEKINGLNIENNALVQSLPSLINFGANIKFSQLDILLMLYRVFNIILAIQLIIFINQLFNKNWQVYIILIVIFLLPNVIIYFNKEILALNYLVFSNLFGINLILKDLNFVALISYIIFAIFFSILLYLYNCKLWTKIKL